MPTIIVIEIEGDYSMDKHTVDEIIACLPQGKTFFYYFKDRYALMLLAQAVADEMSITALKQTPYARLLNKPLIKQYLAKAGNGQLKRDTLDAIWEPEPLIFLLGLSTWGNKRKDSWYQTSRAGYNLVLQLNFSNQHEAAYRALVKPRHNHVFNPYAMHPIAKEPCGAMFRNTLAWARIDLDFEHDQALIEEIQSDWVREVRDMEGELKDYMDNEPMYERGMNGRKRHVSKYLNQIITPYIRIWDEAMLAATLHFIRNELGIRTVFYHSFETGAVLKQCNPPRYLYRDLPRRFCFEKTSEIPAFLQGNKLVKKALCKVRRAYWYRLSLLPPGPVGKYPVAHRQSCC